MSSLTYLNGTPVSDQVVGERMFQYADGVFETMRSCRGDIPLWSFHKQRLQRSAERLYLNICFDTLEAQLERALAASNEPSARVKLMVGRSGSSRASYLPECASCSYLLSLAPYTARHHSQSVALRSTAKPLPSFSPYVGLKLINRLDYILASQGAEIHTGQDLRCELAFVDQDQQVLEAMHHNIFWMLEGKVHTPALKHYGVHGVMREYLFSLAKTEGTFSVSEKSASLADISQADAVFLTNAVEGIVPVNSIDGVPTALCSALLDLQQKIDSVFACQ